MPRGAPEEKRKHKAGTPSLEREAEVCRSRNALCSGQPARGGRAWNHPFSAAPGNAGEAGEGQVFFFARHACFWCWGSSCFCFLFVFVVWLFLVGFISEMITYRSINATISIVSHLLGYL